MSPAHATIAAAAAAAQQVSIDKTRIAEAVARRQTTAPGSSQDADCEQERELRQNFRRLIDPGIVRPNSKDSFLNAINTLATIARNLLREPENPKYQRFKPTNTIIKNYLVEVPGALEYAIAMGFRAEVENFQPYYVHSKRHMRDLRVGEAIIAETLQRENDKAQRAMQSSTSEKSVRKDVAEKVKMNYLDDRREKKLRDDMERQRRQAVLEQAEHRAQSEATSVSTDSKDQSQLEPSMAKSDEADFLGERSDESDSISEPHSESER